MDRIGDIIQPRPSNDGAEFVAAATVATANEQIKELFGFTPLEASAKSIRDGTLLVETEHGAMSGMIMRRADELMQKTNSAISRRFSRNGNIQRVVTRQR